MKKHCFLGLLAVLSAFAAAVAGSPEEAIEQGNQAFIDAFAKGDAAALAAVYDADGSRLSPTGEVVRGTAAIAERVGEFLQKVGTVKVTIATENLWVIDDMAYETGKYTFTFTPQEEPERTLAGQYVTIWKRQDDGGWKIYADMSVPCGGKDE
jgi:uncharacterized protein (TIGR02246 family)